MIDAFLSRHFQKPHQVIMGLVGHGVHGRHVD